MDENKAAELFQQFIEEPPEVFAGAVAQMTEVDRAFFNGYVCGYVKGVAHTQAAIEEDGVNNYPSDKTPS